MLYINTLRISDNRQTIDINIETSEGNTITQILFWDKDTYKDYSTAIDLSSKLSQTNNVEIISVLPSDLGIENFDGIYIFEFTTTDVDTDQCSDCNESTLIGVTADFTKYHECILDSILKNNNIDSAIKIHLTFEAVYSALKLGWYEEAIYLLSYLDDYCKGDCISCKDSSITVKTGLGFGVLNNNIIL